MNEKYKNSLYLEDFHAGDVFITPEHKVTEEEVMEFCVMTGDMHPNHTDEEYMKHTQFGTRIAHGMLGMSLAHGLMCSMKYYEDSVISVVAVENWAFRAPVFLNDTVHTRAEVLETRESRSKPDRGILKMRYTLLTQSGVEAQQGDFVFIIKKRPQE